MRIHVGCSGWSYDEWDGVFYPDRVSDKLSFYSMVFNTVEIDSTFYRIPERSTVKRWRKVMAGKPFTFSVKVPGDVTHDSIFSDLGTACNIFGTFKEIVLEELSKDNLLGPVLFQMPPRFDVNDADRLEYLIKCAGIKNAAVEVRNRTLYENSDFRKMIEGLGAVIVDVDSTEKRLQRIESNLSWAYVRLHGRTTGGWKAENPFDYRYTDEEIREIASKIESVKYDDIFVYFNNHPHGSAPVNAMMLTRILGISNNAFF
ncbi:DUF72 domain-containing protein [Thermoplasma sp.]|uniref:DUF72 domain-containing protein n=1 Tax=Thermoplasma sp. TaxID=1973142 RepID=UPI0026236DE3|nr:DUF72 domain-containing protein [Thermoplasma sp.]